MLTLGYVYCHHREVAQMGISEAPTGLGRYNSMSCHCVAGTRGFLLCQVSIPFYCAYLFGISHLDSCPTIDILSIVYVNVYYADVR